MTYNAFQYTLNRHEYELLQEFIQERCSKAFRKRIPLPKSSSAYRPGANYNPAAIRAASRVFIASISVLKIWDTISEQLLKRESPNGPARRKTSLIRSTNFRLAASLSTILLLHRLLFRFFARLRLRLLSEKASHLRKRYPKIFRGLTSRLAPAVGASVAGFALEVYPRGQLRVTAAIYLGAMSLEYLYNALEGEGYFKNMPWWFGSWLLFPLAQGQLLYAFVFDRDCFPKEYGDFILKYTPDYIQRRPANVSERLVWPTSNQVVDSLAEMARLRWPLFVSPILHPSKVSPLPASIDPVISPIISRAHPSLQHLSCALIHPSHSSCFSAYLNQNLEAFPQLARFFAIYYSAFALLRYKQLRKSPGKFINHLSKQILKTTAAISGAIGASWGTICLFAAFFPRSFLPRSRFFIGGLLGGCFQFFDRGSSGRVNALYASRISVDSLWKVGVKHGWWKGIQGGDVWVFVAALTVLNTLFETRRAAVNSAGVRKVIGVMRGEEDLGLGPRKEVENSERVSSKKD